MEYTQNYALRKPGLNEYANVGDLNYNSDKIDSQMKKNQDVDGEVYDPTSTSANAYEAGDYVINPDDGLMYVCNGTTYGTWDATKWDHTTEFEEIQKAMASGGESELANLHDVDITNPTDGQALLYDDTTDKWHNSDLPDADVTKTASGNPIEFSDGADAPLVKCVTAITGYQEGSGTPSPDNIRPITAYTEGEIEVRGKNILPLTVANLKTINTTGTWTGNNYANSGITFAIQTDENGLVTGIKCTGTSSAVSALYILYNAPNNYSGDKLNGCPSSGMGNGTGIAIQYYDNGQYVSADQNYGGDITITESDEVYLLVRVANGYSFPASGLTFNPMIRLAQDADSDYEPYKGTTHTTTYPSAIYRGSEDVVNGEVMGEWGYSKGGTRGSIDSSGKLYKIADLNDSEFTQSGDVANMISSHLPVLSLEGARAADYPSICKYGVTVYIGGFVGNENALDALLPDLEVSYKLATPTTSSVTPTNLPIKSLSGYNHIESSTGDMEIEYFPQKEQPLIDLIPEASNMHTYSTAEHAVGTWIDGETIYEQTYTYSGTGAANPFTTTIDMTGKNLLEVIPHYARYTYNSGQSYGECIGSELLYNSSSVLNIRYVDSVPYTLTVTSGLGSTDSYDIAFTLRYTKTASNNRSLAKSAPTEEIKEEQVEELKEETKEEPTEEVKEEVKEEETIDPETNEEAKR